MKKLEFRFCKWKKYTFFQQIGLSNCLQLCDIILEFNARSLKSPEMKNSTRSCSVVKNQDNTQWHKHIYFVWNQFDFW